MDLQVYLASIGSTIFAGGFDIQDVPSLSADGNAMLVTIYDERNTCTLPTESLTTFNAGVLYLDASSVACDPPRIALSPKDWIERYDYSYGSALNVTASGSWPLTYQWQREDPQSPGTWIDLTEGCSNFDSSNWDYEGVNKNQLRIGQHYGGSGRGGRYRVVVSNSCGSVTSDAATLTFNSGACCLGDYCLADTYELACLDPTYAGGVYAGDGTTCDTNPCVQTVSGACCSGSGCLVTTVDACSAANSFFNANAACNDPGNSVSPCCKADFNHASGLSVQDIFDFLNAWFAGNVQADFNGDGSLAVQDIFDFLNAWFAGC
jgi:hypothetical protein